MTSCDQAKGVEQQLPQLFGRGQVEVHTGGRFGLRFQALQSRAHLLAEIMKIAHINADARGLHLSEHWLQRLFHLLQQLQQLGPHGAQLMAQQEGQTPGDVHVHAAVEAGGLQRYIGKGLFLAH